MQWINYLGLHPIHYAQMRSINYLRFHLIHHAQTQSINHFRFHPIQLLTITMHRNTLPCEKAGVPQLAPTHIYIYIYIFIYMRIRFTILNLIRFMIASTVLSDLAPGKPIHFIMHFLTFRCRSPWVRYENEVRASRKSLRSPRALSGENRLGKTSPASGANCKIPSNYDLWRQIFATKTKDHCPPSYPELQTTPPNSRRLPPELQTTPLEHQTTPRTIRVSRVRLCGFEERGAGSDGYGVEQKSRR